MPNGLLRINYRPDEHGQKSEMPFSFNPFKKFVMRRKYPFARILRKGFLGGLSDTYDVIVGNHYNRNKDGTAHAGILDILLFPLIARKLMATAYDKDNHPLVRAAAFIPAVIFEFPRILIGAVLTLALSPFVALTHIFTAPKAKHLRQIAGNTQIEVVADRSNPGSTQRATLSTFMAANKFTLDQMKEYRIGDSAPDESVQMTSQSNPPRANYYDFHANLTQFFRVKVDGNNTDPGIEALRKLGFGSFRQKSG